MDLSLVSTVLLNETVSLDLNESFIYLEVTIKIKTIAILVVLLIGFIGHFLTIFVFSQRRFRINSSSVYLLCLSINDGFFLVIHFYEDSLEVLKHSYLSLENKDLNSLVKLLYLIDQNELACRLVNYFRYVLRFISAYIIVVFTIQRLLIVYSPVKNRFKSNKTAWKTVLNISIASIILNIWVPFLFEIQKTDDDLLYCDSKKSLSEEYFHINYVYIASIMLIPIIVICISNSLIIFITLRNDFRRRSLQQFQERSIRRRSKFNLEPVKSTEDSACLNEVR